MKEMKHMKSVTIFIAAVLISFSAVAQKGKLKIGSPEKESWADTSIKYILDPGELSATDTMPTINLNDVTVVSFKTKEDWMMYYKYKSRIIKVMPYVKIANQLYAELKAEKENDSKRGYRHYRKDVEKEMRTKFEKELKDLSVGQGEMLFKLLNRETGNNAYYIIKELKGGVTAWFYQLVGKRYGYDLKENYDPEKEKMIELIIRELGPAYNVKS